MRRGARCWEFRFLVLVGGGKGIWEGGAVTGVYGVLGWIRRLGGLSVSVV